jgi:hypothetical protein
VCEPEWWGGSGESKTDGVGGLVEADDDEVNGASDLGHSWLDALEANKQYGSNLEMI